MKPNQSHLLRVGFIDFEDDEDDIGLSFAIYDAGEYIDSIMLARSAYDTMLDESDRGVRVRYEKVLGHHHHTILLHKVNLHGSTLEMTLSTKHQFALDLSKLEQSHKEIVKDILKKLNLDNRYTLTIDNEAIIAGPQTAAVAICWYQREEWEILKRESADPDVMDNTYREWKANASKAMQEMQAAGHKVQKINIKSDAVAAWCKAQGRANDAAARTEYTIEIARQRNAK